MDVGYFMMPLHPPGRGMAATIAEDLEQIAVLDRLGYTEAWIGEHFTAEWENIPCPDLFIAQALGMTKNIKLGTGVSLLPYHQPAMLANRIAQLDQMARGRFYWGIGSGGLPGDFGLFNIDGETQEQRQLTRDVLDAILMLWNDPAPGVYEHRRWRFSVMDPIPELAARVHVQPYQRPHPPIAVAGVGPKSDMLTLAGERGWIPMSSNIVVTPTLTKHWEHYSACAQSAGYQPSRSIWRVARDVYIGETSAQARRDVLDGVLARDWRDYFLGILKGRMMIAMKNDPEMPDEDVTPEYLCDNLWIVGDVDEVTAKLRALYDEVGGFGTLLVIAHEWEPRDKWLRSMTLLKNEVLPRLPTVPELATVIKR